MKIFVDTSGIIAAMNSKDQHHQQANEIFSRAAHQKAILVITNYIRNETHALLTGRAGRKIALRFLEDQSWAIEWITPEDEEKAIDLLRHYSDKSFSLTDATSFIIMERLKIKHAIAFDQHFYQYGFYLPHF